MTTVTEVALFRKIVEEPAAIQLSDLNISSMLQSSTMDQIQDKKEAMKKCYLKLIHQIWSGTTKSIRQNCHVQNLPIEFPGLGCFVPRISNPEHGRLTVDALEKVEMQSEVIFVVDGKF